MINYKDEKSMLHLNFKFSSIDRHIRFLCLKALSFSEKGKFTDNFLHISEYSKAVTTITILMILKMSYTVIEVT